MGGVAGTHLTFPAPDFRVRWSSSPSPSRCGSRSLPLYSRLADRASVQKKTRPRRCGLRSRGGAGAATLSRQDGPRAFLPQQWVSRSRFRERRAGPLQHCPRGTSLPPAAPPGPSLRRGGSRPAPVPDARSDRRRCAVAGVSRGRHDGLGSQCDLLAFRGDASALDRADLSRGTPRKKEDTFFGAPRAARRSSRRPGSRCSSRLGARRGGGSHQIPTQYTEQKGRRTKERKG